MLGIGNDILRDDGIGPRLVMDLEKREFPENVKFMTISLGGLETLELIKDFDRVIILDAIKTGTGKPGDIHRYSPADFKETLHLSNLHDINFLTSLELAKRLGIKIPEEIRIIAVEIVEDMEFGAEFTPELARRYPSILEKVYQELRSLIHF